MDLEADDDFERDSGDEPEMDHDREHDPAEFDPPGRIEGGQGL